MSFGPCLCGDPACGRCFPGLQVPVRCPKESCGWTGRLCDADGVPDEEPDAPSETGYCPRCDTVVDYVEEEDYESQSRQEHDDIMREILGGSDDD